MQLFIFSQLHMGRVRSLFKYAKTPRILGCGTPVSALRKAAG